MKKWLALIITVCLLSAVFTGCARSEATPQDTAVVSRGELVISVSVSGNLEMPHKMDLSFGTTGTVTEVLVSEGDKVNKDQVLAKLDARSLELNVTMAQARCEASWAEYEMAENRLMQTIYPYYTYTHTSDLPGTWLTLEKAQANLEEAEKLLEQGNIDEAQKLLEQVQEDLDKAQKKLQSRTWQLPFSVKLVELQVDEAKAGLDIAKAELARSELELDKATIVAPFDGIVTDVMIKEGQQLSAMNYVNPAVSLVDPGEIKMDGVIDEVDIAKVKLGQRAVVTLDALPDKEVNGIVTFISQAGTVKAGVVSYQTTITLQNPDKELRDGMSATADIIIECHGDVLLIPNRAIQGSWEKPWVEVIADDGTEKREIALGLSDGINAEVLSGLKEGEVVVLPSVSHMPFGFM
ncbi:MAG: efflux RND transporter periplasmic adaptor subunit [Chloroflexota bacterium]|nr:efflux RND transporter periplasmic adaptor subunit [Chloroflexota bacterium]